MNNNSKNKKQVHATNSKLYKKFKILLILSIILIGGGSFYGWIYSKFYISNSNAYLAIDTVPINSLIDGKIKLIHVERDQYVNAGDILINFDKQELAEKLLTAQANLLIVKEKLKLMEFQKQQAIKLWKDHLIPLNEYTITINDYNLVKSQYEKIYQQVLNLEEALKNIQVTAANSGWIIDVPLQIGDTVKNQQKLCDLVKDQAFSIHANLTKTELTKIKHGQKAKVIIKDFPNYTFEGKVVKVTNPITIAIAKNKFHLPLRNCMHAKLEIMLWEAGKYYNFFN